MSAPCASRVKSGQQCRPTCEAGAAAGPSLRWFHRRACPDLGPRSALESYLATWHGPCPALGKGRAGVKPKRGVWSAAAIQVDGPSCRTSHPAVISAERLARRRINHELGMLSYGRFPVISATCCAAARITRSKPISWPARRIPGADRCLGPRP